MAANPKQDSVDVLAVIRAPLEQYPPSVHQVALLAEAGLRVAVVDTFHRRNTEISFTPGTSVQRIRTARHTVSHIEQFPSFPIRYWRAAQFGWKTFRALKSLRPKVVIAYDAQGCHAVGRVMLRRDWPQMVCHIHDFPGTDDYGIGTWLANSYYLKFAREAHLVVVPDRGRAGVLMEQARLSCPPAVVMNCPRLLREIPRSTMSAHLGKVFNSDTRIVFFQGWINEGKGLETAVRSMKHWPANSIFVLLGPARPEYREKLLRLSHGAGAHGRLILIPMVPFTEVDAITAGADVAFGIYPTPTDDLNWRYMAGASNKRFAYMSLGLPQVANRGHGMKEVIERPHCGLLVDPNSADEIGSAIRLLLENESLRHEMGRNGRQAHLTEFNYEKEFAPVLKQIVEWCKFSSSSSCAG